MESAVMVCFVEVVCSNLVFCGSLVGASCYS
jgi:hypothetical protein